MGAVFIEIPADLTEAMRTPPEEQTARLRRELAIRLYEKSLLSFGKARELAGDSKWEFHRLLCQEGIARRIDLEELQHDLDTLESLG